MYHVSLAYNVSHMQKKIVYYHVSHLYCLCHMHQVSRVFETVDVFGHGDWRGGKGGVCICAHNFVTLQVSNVYQVSNIKHVPHVHNVSNVHATSSMYQVSFAFDVSLVPCALCVHVAHVHFVYFCLMSTMCSHVHRLHV